MTTTTNMGLTEPTVNGTPAPDWGNQLNADLSLIDLHDHSPGKGVTVPTAGLNINADLSFGAHGAKNLSTVQFYAAASPTGPLTLYTDGNDLYYKDGSGHYIKITSGGQVNGTSGGGSGGVSYFLVAANVAGLKALPSTQITSALVVKTLYYSVPGDNGAWLYQWDANSTATADDVFCLLPVDAPSIGRWLAILQMGDFDLSAAGFDTTGQTPNGRKLWALWKSARLFGCKRLLLPAGRIDVRDLDGDPNNVLNQGVRNCALHGRGQDISTISTYVMMDNELPTPVRLATDSALPSCVAAGAGVGKTLTMTANGQITVNTKAVVLNDRILVKDQANKVDNGIYKCTQQGNAGAPCILTRATDFDQSDAIKQRIGVRTTDGNPANNQFIAFVLSGLANEFWSTAAMTVDVSAQYWTAERFIPTHLLMWPTTEQRIFGYAVPAYPPTNWTERVVGGQTAMHNVGFLNGGTWVDPDDGLTYTLSAIKPGDSLYLQLAGTPTDQGQWWWGYKAKVSSVNHTTNDVLLDIPAQQTSIMCSSAGTPGAYQILNWQIGQISAVGANQFTLSPAYLAGGFAVGDNVRVSATSSGTSFRTGTAVVASINTGTGVVTVNPGTLPAGTVANDYAFHDHMFPFTYTPPSSLGYAQNQARHTFDNEYIKFVEETANIELANLTVDGTTINFNFVDGVRIVDVTQRNCHAGAMFSGCQRKRVERFRQVNVTGWNFPGVSGGGAGTWYGWALQNNFCSDSSYHDYVCDGLSADLTDQEGENETSFYGVTVRLKPCPATVTPVSQSIMSTTAGCTRKNPCINLTVYGSYNATATPQLTEPVHNLQWKAFNASNNSTGFAGGGLSYLSGIFGYKGRLYDMGRRRKWHMLCPLTATSTRAIKRPWQGLWANTRIYMPNITGWTQFKITPNLVGGIDLLPIIQVLFTAGQWIRLEAADDFLATYANATDDEMQTLTVQTDGTVPAGSYFILETDILQEVERGDLYSGISDITPNQIPPHALMAKIPDKSVPLWRYSNAAPAAIADFPGQKHRNYTAGTEYEAIDVLAVGDWKQVF